MLEILDDLIEYYQSVDNKSLIAKIYGIFTIKTNKFNTIHVMIMQSTLQRHNKSLPCLTFDLKGSTIGRRTKLAELEQNFWLSG